MIKLICINDRVIKKKNNYTGEIVDQMGIGLERGKHYIGTATAICDCGHLFYRIAELDNKPKLI